MEVGGYVITSLAGYYDKGNFYPAYCLDRHLHGVGEDGGYNVTLTELIKDTEMYNKVWRVTVAGYPYHTASDLGVRDWTYAYQATKMAVYCVTGQADVTDFYADDSIGQEIVDLIHRLVYEGEHGTGTYRTALAEINKIGELDLNGNYYIQNYNLNSNLDLSNYTISITSFPEGTIVTDESGNTKDTFNQSEHFQVRIPKEKLETQDINGRIRADIETKEYAIFYGASYNDATQDYVVSADPISFSSCFANLSVKNNRSKIEVHKYNEDKSASIEGVKFSLIKDGKVVQTVKTNADGIATFNNLYKGNYSIKEVETVNGYILNNDIKEVTVDYNGVAQIEATNSEPTGEIKAIKIDSDTKNGKHGDATINGTEYTLYASEDIFNVAKTVKYFSKDEAIATFTFDNNGVAKINVKNSNVSLSVDGDLLKGLPLGKYYAKETKVPTGYTQDTEIHNIELKYKDMNTKVIKSENTFKNTVERAKFEVIKISSIENTTASTISGAEFTAILKKHVDKYGSFNEALKHLDEYAKDEYSVFKTAENGHGTSGLLAYGEYVVEETYCPSDLVNPVKPFTVVIDKNSNGVIKELVENDTPFESYLKIVKKDAKTGKVVTFSNATFSLYKLNKDNNKWEKVKCKLGKETFDKWKTDNQGIAYTETKLAAGTYKIDEIGVPKGFLQSNEEIIFDVSRSNKTLTYDNDGDAYITAIVQNEQPTGSLLINKSVEKRKDADKSLIDVSNLSGIKFKLSAKENIIDMIDGSTIYVKGQEIKTFNLDKNGNYKIDKLPLGVYELQEIETLDGLVLDTKKYEVKIEQKDTTTKVYSVSENIVNNTTMFEFFKTDVTGEKEIPGATITVKDKEGKIVDKWVSNEKGHKIEGLKVGETYTLTEEIAPQGYVKATSIKFTVKNTKEIQKVTMKDKIVEMTKVDIAGKEIEGAKMQVFDKDKKLVDEWVSGKEAHKINNLVEGNSYILHEEVAADGYVKATDIEFEVTTKKENQKVIMKDKIVEMTKVDVAGKEIEGAKMQVFDKDKKLVDEWKSSKEPHKIKNLVEGNKYILHEEVAADGYVKATDIEFEVTTKKENQKVTMKDKIVEMTKLDIAGKEIEGAELKVLDKNGNVVDSWKSTKTPHKIKNLEEGQSYILVEDYAPNGYVISNQVEFKVTTEKKNQKLEMTDKIVEILKTDVNGKAIKGATLTITSTKTKNIVDKWETTNEPHKVSGLIEGQTYILHEEITANGYVKAKDIEFTVTEDKKTQRITMKDKIVEMTKADITGEEVEGAELKVVDKKGKVVDSWKSTKKPHKINGLEEGQTYTLIEDYAPNGYVISNQVEFKVTTEKKNQKLEMIDKIVEILKTDVDGKAVEGATLTITSNKTKNIVDQWKTTKEPHKVSGLIEGQTYTLHEEIVVDGYVKASDIEFTVTYEKETQKITMIDKVVEIVKTDLVTSEEIEGAELEIIEKETGKTIDKWISTKEPHKVIGLEEGKEYTLIEKTCPYGYEQAESIDFTVTEEKQNQKIEMKDMPILSNIKVVKVDSRTKQAIKDNFVFGLYADNECKKLIMQMDSNSEDGTVLFEDLRFGTYFVKEVSAPNGYELSNEVAKIEINNEGLFVNGSKVEKLDGVYSFDFENTRIPKIQTGNETNYAVLIGSIVVSLLSIISGIFVLKKNKEVQGN